MHGWVLVPMIPQEVRSSNLPPPPTFGPPELCGVVVVSPELLPGVVVVGVFAGAAVDVVALDVVAAAEAVVEVERPFDLAVVVVV